MINLTENEKKILKAIPQDDFYEDGLDSVIWADVFVDYCPLDGKQARGVLSSLIKKGIINPILHGRDGSISFTKYGKTLMIELGYAE